MTYDALVLAMPRAIPLALAAIFLAPLALAEQYDDPVHDEVIGFPPGPAVATLAGCESPSADIVGVSIGREGGDIVTRVRMRDRDGPLACGALAGNWVTSSAYLEVYTEDLASSINIIVDSFDGAYGNPDGVWRVSAVLYVGENGGAYNGTSVPAAQLWQGDTFEVRLPASGTTNGIPYDTAGLVMHGYVNMNAWTTWPDVAGYGLLQRSHDRAEIGLVTL